LFTRILIFEVIVAPWITLAIFIFLKVYAEEGKLYGGFYACLAGAMLSEILSRVRFPR
jgi:hypothetical protein